MSGIYIFLGPTACPEELRPIPGATYLPPVSQGDVLSLLRHAPDVIGIIDGYFERVPAVWHKEILQALAQGVHVVGGSSMGALRAAELYPFGMVGVGQVFEWYRDGLITADDEVAIRHASAEDDYQAFSEAMVNIRASLGLAVQQGVISPATHDALITLSRAMPYYTRSYPALLTKAAERALPAQELADLREFLRHSRIDQKKRDALAVAEHIRQYRPEHKPAPVSFELQTTTRLAELAQRDLYFTVTDGLRITPEVIVERAQTQLPNFAQLHEQAGMQSLLLRLAHQLNLRLSEAEFEHGLTEFKQKYELASEVALNCWLAENQLTAEEFNQLVSDELLIAKLQKTFPPNPHDLLRSLRLAGRYRDLGRTMTESKEVENV